MNNFKLIILALIINLNAFLLSAETVSATAKDTVKTDEVVVSATREPVLFSENGRMVTTVSKSEIAALPAIDFQDVLKKTFSADVRQRGFFGAQADVSLRGGTFDQTLVLLNGVNISDPQTGHHNMDIPLDFSSISRIEVLEGSGSRIFGPNAFAGAINIITDEPGKNRAGISLSGGSNHYWNAVLSGSAYISGLNNYISISKSRSDGYTDDTDFDLANIYYHGSVSAAGGKFEGQAGYADKKFGANSFYTPEYPNQYEKTKTLFTYLGYSTGTILKFSADAYWRRHNDVFVLSRDHPDWYTNYHRTDVYGGTLKSSYEETFGTTSLGFEIRSENILSNVLGEPMTDTIDVPGEPGGKYTHSAERLDLNFFLEQNLNLNDLSVSAGVAVNRSNEYGVAADPGIDLNYKLGASYSLFGNVNFSHRLPTFTDLYYSDPSSKGNPDLKPEKAVSYEAGMKYAGIFLRAQASLFYRNGKSVIDWVKLPGDSLWRSANLTEVNSWGEELILSFLPCELLGSSFPITAINLNYIVMSMNKVTGDFQSEYVLDFLRNKLNLNLVHNLIFNIKISWNVSFYDRAGNYTDYKTKQLTDFEPFTLVDAKIFYNFKNINIYLLGTNILNKSYADISNVKLPGRWISLGISGNIDF